VGDAGQIWSSPGGITWTDRSVGGNYLVDVAYGGGLFVAVGDAGQIWSSPGGINWTDRSPGGNNLRGVGYTSDTFVAVGAAGTILQAGAVTAAPSPTGATQYTLTVNVEGPGRGWVVSSPGSIDCPNNCTQTFDAGTVVTLTQTPDKGGIMDWWGGACDGQGRAWPCVLTMDGDKSVRAWFTAYQPAPVNNPPAAPRLIAPEDGATMRRGGAAHREVAVEFQWYRAADPDGETVTYELNICTDPGFAGCQPVAVASLSPDGAVERAGAGLFAGWGAAGVFLFAFTAGGRRRLMAFFIGMNKIIKQSLAAGHHF